MLPALLLPCSPVILLALGACSEPDRESGRVYLGSGLTDQVFVLDAQDGRILDTLALNPRMGEMDEPHGLAVAPDGRHWYATVSHGEPTLWKYEAADDRLVGRLTLGVPGAGRIGISPDGRRAVIPDYWRTGQGAETQISVIALHDLVEEATLTVCPAPHDAQFDPTGRFVAVTCSLSDEVVILDAASMETLERFAVDADPGVAGEPRFRPLNLVWAPSGEVVFVTLALANQVRAFRRDGEEVGRAEVGRMPTQLAIGPDGAALVVVNRGGSSLSLLDTDTLTESMRIDLPDVVNPHGIGLSATGDIAFVSFEGDVESAGGAVAVDLPAGVVLWQTAAGAYTLGIAYRQDR